jgi:predicted O-methyltransferase YrrM
LTKLPADLVDEMSTGYRGSQVLLTAHRLGVFEALRDADRASDYLSRELDTDPRGMRILCDALVALGLLEKRDEVFSLALPARQCLLPDSPQSKHALLSHTARLYERWAKLYDAVKSGAPVADDVIDPRLLGDARDFARAMADVARESARKTADALDLSGVTRLLDVGGGPALYALEFARRRDGLEAVVFDRPDTLEVAQASIEAAGLSDRVSVCAGDAFTDDLGGPYDLVFVSNFLHIYPPDENRRLLARCADVLHHGGRLAIKDFLMDPDRTTPAGGAIFAVTMLLSTDGGDCYTTAELREWMSDAGIRLESVVDLTPQSRLAVGVRV